MGHMTVQAITLRRLIVHDICRNAVRYCYLLCRLHRRGSNLLTLAYHGRMCFNAHQYARAAHYFRLQAVDCYSKSPLDPEFNVDRNLVDVAQAMYHAWIQTGMVVTVGLGSCRHCVLSKCFYCNVQELCPFSRPTVYAVCMFNHTCSSARLTVVGAFNPQA